MQFSLPRLYAIIDPAQAGGRSPAAIAEAFLAAGVRCIQYRDKRATSREMFETSQEIAARARQASATFIVNDRADVALTADADGVHLGQDDLPVELARRILGPAKLLGYSTHTPTQVIEADRSSADYIAFGPVFKTASKEKPDSTVGLEGLRQARKLTRKPLVAIGGITVENARAAIEAGADSVAVIGDLMRHTDPGVRARRFIEILAGAQ